MQAQGVKPTKDLNPGVMKRLVLLAVPFIPAALSARPSAVAGCPGTEGDFRQMETAGSHYIAISEAAGSEGRRTTSAGLEALSHRNLFGRLWTQRGFWVSIIPAAGGVERADEESDAH